MKKILFFCIATLVFGRENPFMPQENEQTMSTNLKLANGKEITPLKSEISKVDTAKLNQKIIDENLKADIIASISSKDKFIPTTPEKNKKNPKIGDVKVSKIQSDIKINDNNEKIHPNLVKSETNKPKKLAQNLDKTDKNITQPSKSLTQVVTIKDFFSTKISPNLIEIYTKNPLFRHFSLKDENKIAFDFKREKTNFYTKKQKVGFDTIKSIAIGSHESFYRFALKLDKNRDYSITQKGEVYLIEIK